MSVVQTTYRSLSMNSCFKQRQIKNEIRNKNDIVVCARQQLLDIAHPIVVVVVLLF